MPAYERLTLKTGIDAVNQYIGTFDIQPGADGVVFASPDANPYFSDVAIPDRLRKFLVDLRLLRHIPIAYFVPDAALLPPESIRFFHLDPTWLDRVTDGVFAADDTGTVDAVFGASMLAMLRAAIDTELASLAESVQPGSGWTVDDGMTGVLIRSELVRRWPDLIIRAYKTVKDNADPDQPNGPARLPILRQEAISKDLLIAIIGGTPQMVHVREPHVGVRFGVEENPVGSTTWTVDKRTTDGLIAAGPSLTVKPRNAAARTLDIADLASKTGNAPRMVALNLEQRPYVEEFKNTVPESKGSAPFSEFVNADGSLAVITLRNGRSLNLASLQTRQQQLMQLDPKVKP